MDRETMESGLTTQSRSTLGVFEGCNGDDAGSGAAAQRGKPRGGGLVA